MHVKSALLAVLIAAAYGCATEPEQKPAGAAAPAPAQSQSSRAYRTGSRLPSMDDEGGSSSLSGVSRDDYMDDRNRGGTSGVRGN